MKKEKYTKNLENIEKYGMEIIEFWCPANYFEHFDMVLLIIDYRAEGGEVIIPTERSVNPNTGSPPPGFLLEFHLNLLEFWAE